MTRTPFIGHLSALLNDVDAAMKETDVAPSVVFSPGAAAHAGGNTNADEQQGATTEGGVPNADGEVDDIRLEESEDDDTDDDGDEGKDDEPIIAATETIVPIVPLRSVAADLPQSAVITDGGDIGPISIESTDKDATSGFQTHEKKNSKEFVRIGRYFCSYKSFFESLKPRHYLDSEVMNVWVEKFNREAKIVAQKNPREKEKYAFTQFMVDKLIVDPAAFDLDSCMKELKLVNAKFKILKDDLLYFPIVKNSHWVVCCINIILKQFHIFDLMRSSKDISLLEQYGLTLFANFNTLVIASKLSTSNFTEFTLNTPDHPQQTTMFDCGFFSQLFMDNFNAKVMAHFDNNAIPDHRKAIAASVIEARDNGDVAIESVMEEELIKKK
ncbi:hypothetical protein ACQ4PT_023221 [Festuca glaucescens]